MKTVLILGVMFAAVLPLAVTARAGSMTKAKAHTIMVESLPSDLCKDYYSRCRQISKSGCESLAKAAVNQCLAQEEPQVADPLAGMEAFRILSSQVEKCSHKILLAGIEPKYAATHAPACEETRRLISNPDAPTSKADWIVLQQFSAPATLVWTYGSYWKDCFGVSVTQKDCERDCRRHIDACLESAPATRLGHERRKESLELDVCASKRFTRELRAKHPKIQSAECSKTEAGLANRIEP